MRNSYKEISLSSNIMECSEIHRRFVEYYQNIGFQCLPRAPMMHPSFPMSFVMSAGLVQVGEQHIVSLN